MPIKQLDTVGVAVAKKELTPIAVKTNSDSTVEVLTVNTKTNKYEVHYTSTEGTLLSKSYIPDTPIKPSNVSSKDLTKSENPTLARRIIEEEEEEEEVEIIQEYLRSGVNNNPSSVTGNSSNTPGSNSSGSLPVNVPNSVDVSKLPVNPQKAAELGTMPKPGPTMYVTYDQMKMIEEKNRIFEVDSRGRAKIKGPHAIEKHVAKEPEYLEFRVDPTHENVPAASTFLSKEVFEIEVNKVLQANWVDIEKWLLSSNIKKDFSGDIQHNPIGIVLEQNPRNEKISFQIKKVVLKKDGKGGYYILTNLLK